MTSIYFCESIRTFIYEEKSRIDKSLPSEVASSNILRSAIDSCFRKINRFFDFRFDSKIENF